MVIFIFIITQLLTVFKPMTIWQKIEEQMGMGSGCKKRGQGATTPHKILAMGGQGPIFMAKFGLSGIALSKLPYC